MIEVFGCFGIDMTNDAPNPITAESDHLVRQPGIAGFRGCASRIPE
jgi:hypothetical protein